MSGRRINASKRVDQFAGMTTVQWQERLEEVSRKEQRLRNMASFNVGMNKYENRGDFGS
jgi:hypothetical protein